MPAVQGLQVQYGVLDTGPEARILTQLAILKMGAGPFDALQVAQPISRSLYQTLPFATAGLHFLGG